MNKSSMTSVISLLLYLIGIWLSSVSEEAYLIIASYIKSAGAFALAGSITNWLAIHMLFEKLPFLYGSGVIPNNFESFKAGIKHMILEHFFSPQNFETISKEINASLADDTIPIKFVTDNIDMDKFFDALVETMLESHISSLLKMIGGSSFLEKFRDSFNDKMSVTLVEIVRDINFEEIHHHTFSYEHARPKIELMIDTRLDELSAEEVKEIIAKMIKSHLGWLVVWGGVFGALLGIVYNFIAVW